MREDAQTIHTGSNKYSDGATRQMSINIEDKTHTCPDCGTEAIILVDIETESTSETDESGNKQYHCPSCHKTFAVDADGIVVQPPPDEKQ